jgi:hypothetical protein
MRIKISRPFLCSLIGLAMTVFGWFGPWEWPAAPGLYVLQSFFERITPAVLVLLIVVNAGTWALVAFALLSFSRSFATLRR